MFKTIKTTRAVVLITTALVFLLCGCGKNNSGVTSNVDGEVAEDVASVPDLDEFDAGMSQSHFISMPDSMNDVTLTEGFDTWPTSYDVEYTMNIDEDAASFVLSDGCGQYGEAILLRIAMHSDGAAFGVWKMSGGKVYEDDDAMEYFCYWDGDEEDVLVDEDTQAVENEDESENTAVNKFDVSAVVDDCNIHVSINGIDIGDYEISGFPLGAIGTYKGRDSSFAWVDDISVDTYHEDFEGETNIFAPYYAYVENGQMRIGPGVNLTKIEGKPAPVFRREFECNKAELEHAYLYMTALGGLDISVNGNRISDNFCDPGHLIYNDHLEYVSYDVTDYIVNRDENDSTNTLDITLLHGWYDRAQGFAEIFAPYGDMLAIKGELALVSKAGDVTIIPTDDSFAVSNEGPVRFDDIYQGEIIDANHGNNAESFVKCEVDNVDDKYLNMDIRYKSAGSVGVVETRNPISVSEPESGTYVYDFGQNFSGNIYIDGIVPEEFGVSAGDTITFRYGEILNRDDMTNADDKVGTVWTLGYLTAKSTDYYIAGDSISESAKIDFNHTQHGFRYLQITGINKEIPVGNVYARVLTSATNQIGTFSCSDENINSFYSNSRYSTMSNLMDNPTDCNQRDERLGWAGDAQAVSMFAMYTYDLKGFYNKYLEASRLLQLEDGEFSDTAPEAFGGYGNNVWGDAPVIIAWNSYMQYGDIQVLADNYDACAKWVDYLVEASDDYIRSGEGSYGDHLAHQTTAKELSDTAWSAHSADIVSHMALALQKKDAEKYTAEYEKYSDIYGKFRKSWQEKYIRQEPSVAAGILFDEYESETSYALGIMFGLFDDVMIQDASDRLALLAEYSGYMFYPGYSGAPYVLPALGRYGHADAAYKMLTNTGEGGLLHSMAQGMTTTPEDLRVYDYNDEGELYINGSLNHYANSSMSSYLYSDILGIQPNEETPGYEHFYVRPQIGCGISSAEGTRVTRYGVIEVSWNIEADNGNGNISISVPEGTTCTLVLPGGDVKELEAGVNEVEVIY